MSKPDEVAGGESGEESRVEGPESRAESFMAELFGDVRRGDPPTRLRRDESAYLCAGPATA